MTPEDFFEFVDQGGGSGPVGHHLMDCPECLWLLDGILLCEAPATPEEETVLCQLRAVSPKDLLARFNSE